MGDSQEAGLTTRLLEASVEEAFPTALSSVDLRLEAISKNELIVGKAGVPERVGEGWRRSRAGKGCREGASHHLLGFKVSVWGHMGVHEIWEGLDNGQGRAPPASGSSVRPSASAHLDPGNSEMDSMQGAAGTPRPLSHPGLWFTA